MSLKKQAAKVQAAGYKNKREDSVLAHISPAEAMRLKAQGGSGQPDPHTGLPHFNENGDGGAGGSMGGGDDGGYDGSSGGYDGSNSGLSTGGMADLSGFDGPDGFAGYGGMDSGLGGMGFDGGFNAAKDSQSANMDNGFSPNSDFSGSVNTGFSSNQDNEGFFSNPKVQQALGFLGHLPGLPGFAAKSVSAATSKDPSKSMGNMMGSIAGGILGGVVGGPPGAMAGSALGGKMGQGLSGYGAKDANGNPSNAGSVSAGPGNFGGNTPQGGYNGIGPSMAYSPRMNSQAMSFENGLGGGFNTQPQNIQADGGGGDDTLPGDEGYVSPAATGVYGSPVSGGAGGFDFKNLGALLPGLAGIYSSTQAQGNAGGVANQAGISQNLANSQAQSLADLYGPNSPYAAQLREALGRKDAAAGRNSQYGPREVELQARLADIASRNAPNVLAASNAALSAAGKGYEARQYGTAAQGQTFSKLLGLANQTGLGGWAKSGLSSIFNPTSTDVGTGGFTQNGIAYNNPSAFTGGVVPQSSWPSADAAAEYGSAANNGGGDNFWDSWF